MTKRSRLRGPSWAAAQPMQGASQPDDVGLPLNFGKYTPRQSSFVKDVVEPDYRGFVRRQGLTQMNMMTENETPEKPIFGYKRAVQRTDKSKASDAVPSVRRVKKQERRKPSKRDLSPSASKKLPKDDLDNSIGSPSLERRYRPGETRLRVVEPSIEPAIHFKREKKSIASSRKKIGNTSAVDERLLNETDNDALSWYATETRAALAAYDRALRGKGLPVSHEGLLPSPPVAAPANPNKVPHVFRVWVGAKRSENGYESSNANVDVTRKESEQQRDSGTHNSTGSHSIQDDFDQHHHYDREREPYQLSGSIRSKKSSSKNTTSERNTGGDSMRKAVRKNFISRNQERILGYTPSTNLTRVVNLDNIKPKIDTGLTRGSSATNHHDTRHSLNKSRRVHQPSSSQHLTSERGKSVNQSKIKHVNVRNEETPHKPPAPQRSTRRPVPRKLDVSPKVDTGRTKRYTPGGGKVTVPMGRMPRKAK
eukprot:m.334052 g.334052  ORF g.334052 m.334052 type:complete len:480 (-) comp17275_c0_seq1:139-1578(-)